MNPNTQTVDATETDKKPRGPKIVPSDVDLVLEKMKRLNAKEFRAANRELGKTNPEAAAAEWKAYCDHGRSEDAAIQAGRPWAGRVLGTRTTVGAVLKAGAVVGVGTSLGYLLYKRYQDTHPGDETL